MSAIPQIVNAQRIQSVIKADIALDGGTVANVFTISGGPIQLIGLVGVCTEAVSAHACNARWVMDPTVGIDTNICGNLDIQSLAIGEFLHVTGVIANAMVKSVPGTALPACCGQAVPLVLPVGTIDLTLANSDPTSGIATFYLTYLPLIPGAIVA